MSRVRVSSLPPFAQIAQSVEQGTENPCVRGSIPRLGTIIIDFKQIFHNIAKYNSLEIVNCIFFEILFI